MPYHLTLWKWTHLKLSRPGLCPYRSLISTVNSFIAQIIPPFSILTIYIIYILHFSGLPHSTKLHHLQHDEGGNQMAEAEAEGNYTI